MLAIGVTATEPDVPDAVKPVPVHEVALVELQVSVEELPCVTELGFAVSVTVGASWVIAVKLLCKTQPVASLN